MSGRDAVVKGPYNQGSVRVRIEAFFLDNIGKVATREQIVEVATDPVTNRQPENWHQRLSELRTDRGYTILSWRNRGDLKVSEYLMPNAERRSTASGRARPTVRVWEEVLKAANYRCAWNEVGVLCNLRQGDIDPVGGGTVRLTPDHKLPHALNADTDREDVSKWQPLCGRHQVMKRNYWDDETGWLNVIAIVQSASEEQKRQVLDFLTDYFPDNQD
jgi:hypothetical protein